MQPKRRVGARPASHGPEDPAHLGVCAAQSHGATEALRTLLASHLYLLGLQAVEQLREGLCGTAAALLAQGHIAVLD